MPKRFVFQPMHDAEKLRRYILSNGGYLQRDFTFFDGKFYDVLVGGIGQEPQPYTDAEYEFGKENLQTMPKAFVDRTNKQIKNIETYLLQPNLQEKNREALKERKMRLQGVLNGEIK